MDATATGRHTPMAGFAGARAEALHRQDFGVHRTKSAGYFSRKVQSWCKFLLAADCYVKAAMNPIKPETKAAAEGNTRMSRDTLSITDNRTGKTYELPITNDTIRATD